MTDPTSQCPCCSMKQYSNCCQTFHKGCLPQNALQLMRSRYSAYVLNIPHYIITTTHPASSQYLENKFQWKRGIEKFSQATNFQQLEIVNFQEKNTMATVTFVAHISQNGKDATFTERSLFEKINERWFYRDGQLTKGKDSSLIVNLSKLLPLAYYGDLILRKKAENITEITADTHTLVDEMIETMNALNGVGLAAPQIHHSKRIFVTRIPNEKKSNKTETEEVKIFINPMLSLPSDETWQAPEGCLSIPTIRALMERPKEVTIEYTTLEGKTIKEKVSGWEAKVIMHEYDHIEGVLFIDRLNPEEQAQLLPKLQNLEKRIKESKER